MHLFILSEILVPISLNLLTASVFSFECGFESFDSIIEAQISITVAISCLYSFALSIPSAFFTCSIAEGFAIRSKGRSADIMIFILSVSISFFEYAISCKVVSILLLSGFSVDSLVCVSPLDTSSVLSSFSTVDFSKLLPVPT